MMSEDRVNVAVAQVARPTRDRDMHLFELAIATVALLAAILLALAR